MIRLNLMVLLAALCSVDAANQSGATQKSNTYNKAAKSTANHKNDYDSNEDFGAYYDGEYRYKGRAPFNIVGSLEVASHNMSDAQEIIEYKQNGTWNGTSLKKKDYPGFNTLSMSTAKLQMTLQNVSAHYKYGMTTALKANPGKFEIDQMTLYIKRFFPVSNIKMSLRAGYIYGAERKLETLGHGTVTKTTGLYTLPDYMLVPNSLSAPRINTNSGKGTKITGKIKKIFNKNTNFVVALSYTPHTAHQGYKSFAYVKDVEHDMKNHVGIGAKLIYGSNDLKCRTSATFARGKKTKHDDITFNNAQGIMLGHNMMYKSLVGFGINYGLSLNKNVKEYSTNFKNTFGALNLSHDLNGKANGGYVVSPSVSFIIPQLHKAEFYASYMYAKRATEFTNKKDKKQIYAKSHMFSTGVAVPFDKVIIGSKLEHVKFENPAFKDEQLISASIKEEKSFKSLEKDKSHTILSVFLKVKVAHDMQSFKWA